MVRSGEDNDDDDSVGSKGWKVTIRRAIFACDSAGGPKIFRRFRICVRGCLRRLGVPIEERIPVRGGSGNDDDDDAEDCKEDENNHLRGECGQKERVITRTRMVCGRGNRR